MSQRYFGAWAKENREGLEGFDAMVDAFDSSDVTIEDKDVLFAGYNDDSYNGEALVLFEKDGKLFEVHATHCSCYDLSGQWKPEETTWAALEKRAFGHEFDFDLEGPLRLLISERLAAHGE